VEETGRGTIRFMRSREVNVLEEHEEEKEDEGEQERDCEVVLEEERGRGGEGEGDDARGWGLRRRVDGSLLSSSFLRTNIIAPPPPRTRRGEIPVAVKGVGSSSVLLL